MKKLISFLFVALFTMPLFASRIGDMWTIDNISGVDQAYINGDGDATFVNGVTVSGTLTASGGVTSTGDITQTGNLAVTGNVTQNSVGYVNADSATHYSIKNSTELADTEEFVLVLSSAKACAFTITIGTHQVTGSHTSAGVVTLTNGVNVDQSTTNGNDGSVNVYDAGTHAVIENQLGSTLPAFIEYWWKN